MLLLVYVVVGASVILLWGVSAVMALIVRIGMAEPGGAWPEIIALSLLIALALIGGPIFKQRLPLDVGPVLITATALPLGIGALALVLAIAWVGGVAIGRPHDGVVDGGLFALGSLLILIGVLGEELLLRGLLQPVLVRTWGQAAGVLVASLAFMVIHMVGGWGHPVSLLNILLAGIWFGLLALRTGGLAAPILAHFGYNWAEEMVFGASPNPGVGPFGSIIDVDLVGRAIWGGSAEGLNASVAVSLVLVALIVPLALGRRQNIPTGGKATAQI